jgi:hypothetical protein
VTFQVAEARTRETTMNPGTQMHYVSVRSGTWGLPRRLDENPYLYEMEAPLPLADFECSHDRLAGDPTPACGCWPEEVPVEPPVVVDPVESMEVRERMRRVRAAKVVVPAVCGTELAFRRGCRCVPCRSASNEGRRLRRLVTPDRGTGRPTGVHVGNKLCAGCGCGLDARTDGCSRCYKRHWNRRARA